MATAFSYSGTGLESAIQSGSGGIGTGSSITLEVDAVPSDLSQGDTVKVALGSASDWSGGSGETAYGDVGGAGANGGTNITLTDRGQEGTSAASWSEGAPVRVGVQGRDDAGPERNIAQSRAMGKAGPMIAIADDFDRDDGSIGKDARWTVESGGMSISNKQLVPGSSGDIALTNKTRENILIETFFWTPDTTGEMFRIILSWQDANNYLYYSIMGASPDQLIEVVNGTSSVVAQGISGEEFRGVNAKLQIRTRFKSAFVSTTGNIQTITGFDSTFFASNRAGVEGAANGGQCALNYFIMSGDK